MYSSCPFLGYNNFRPWGLLKLTNTFAVYSPYFTSLLTFVIACRAKFQLEFSENKIVFFSLHHPKSRTPWHQTMDPRFRTAGLDDQYYCWILLPRVNTVQYLCPYATQYYCTVFHLVHGLRGNMLSDNDAGCIVTDLALCLQNIKNRRWTKEWYKRRQYTHENITTLTLSEPFFLRIDGPSFDCTVKTYPTIVKSNTKMRKALTHSQRLFVTLRSGHWKCFWKREIHKGYISII
jgi:hypothetical protein